MLGNRWNIGLGFTSFGESHGPAMGIVFDDVKSGIKFPLDKIKEELAKRRPGNKQFASIRNEPDEIEILSGVFEGYTTGLPICIIIRNKDQKPGDYSYLREVFRPGHSDFTYYKKFKIYDYRGGGRASGRETISRVIAGSFLDSYLNNINIDIFPIQIGKIQINDIDKKKLTSGKEEKLYWPERKSYNILESYLKDIEMKGNSVGGIIRVVISNVSHGLGDPVFEKLDSNLAKALLSIGAVKGIEFGDGFALGSKLGSEANDQIEESGFLTNHSGGILGGISTGQDIIIHCVVKPTPSIAQPQKTIDKQQKNRDIQIAGRHDTCIIPRIIPVMKAMIKLVLADAKAYQNLLENKVLDLPDYREAIDKLDEDLLITLKRRNQISRLIGQYKKKNHVEKEDLNRESYLKESLSQKAEELGLNKETVLKLWDIILTMSKKQQ